MAPPARRRILDAAARLLRERGLARLTTRQIAEAADAAEGSITKNFGGKIGLLIELLSQELPELRAWQEAATPPGSGRCTPCWSTWWSAASTTTRRRSR